MARILVTGASGFIGTNFCYYWSQRYPDDYILAFDALTYAGHVKNLEPLISNDRVVFVQGDICDNERVYYLLTSHKIDMIVHFAAESHVDRSIVGPDAFIQTNIVGTHSLLKAAKKYWLDDQKKMDHLFHHVSTDEVYGSLGKDDPPFTEDMAYAPNSPYAASKAASDHLVRSYHHTYGLNVKTSNCSNNYGSYQFPEKFIPLVIINILLGEVLPIYGDGQQIRDWLHVEDHCRGIDLIIEKGSIGETYNIGGNNEWSNIDIVHYICEQMDIYLTQHPLLEECYPKSPIYQEKKSSWLIHHVRDRLGHDRRYAIDAKKCFEVLGYEPKYSFEVGIKETINWYLNHDVWWQSVMDGSYLEWIKGHYK